MSQYITLRTQTSAATDLLMVPNNLSIEYFSHKRISGRGIRVL